MHLRDLADIGEAVGGIAVLVTLVYLAFQLRLTARIERAVGQRDLLKQAREWIEITVHDPSLFPILQRGLHDWSSLAPGEKERVSGWAWSLLFICEQAVYMGREGLINDVSYRGFMEAGVAVVATPGGRVWWSQARNVIGDDVSIPIDRMLEARPEHAPDWTELLSHFAESIPGG